MSSFDWSDWSDWFANDNWKHKLFGTFKALEFWLLWISTSSACFISSSVFDVKSLEVSNRDGDYVNVAVENPELTTESDFEVYFFGYSAGEALIAVLLVMLVLHCCPSKKRIAKRGRKVYMVRVVQWVKLLVLVGTVVAVAATDQMRFKQGDELVVGRVLLGCDFVSAVIELLILRESLHPTNKIGVLAKTFAEAMVSAMVAAQIVVVQQKQFMFPAIGVTAFYAFCMALCASNAEKLEPFTPLVGFVGGLAVALAFFQGTHKFRSQDEIIAYGMLFAFTFVFPLVKRKYEHVTIEPAYEKSYRRAESPVASPA